MAKYQEIAELFRKRIQKGDYAFNALPGIKKISEETGVSYMTARQAIQTLLSGGVLIQKENGRLEVAPSVASVPRLRVADIRPQPVWGDSGWDVALRECAAAYGCNWRDIFYSHLYDPLLFDALDGDFDLIFLQFEESDPLFLRKLDKLANKSKLVVKYHNLSEMGIRSLEGTPNEAVKVLVRYLKEAGHRKIDFFSTQAMNSVIDDRISCWKRALEQCGVGGTLHNDPHSPGQHFAVAAYEKTRELWESGVLARTDAIFTHSVSLAQAVLRALYDLKVPVPERISVASFGEPEEARLHIPSITVVDSPDPRPQAERIFRCFLGLEKDRGQLRYLPENEYRLNIGESTGPIFRRPRKKNNQENKS